MMSWINSISMLGATTLAVVQLFAGSAMANPKFEEHLILGRGVSAHSENSLLGTSHAGFMVGVYVLVDLGPPWALVLRENDDGSVLLDLREVVDSDSLLFGGTVETVTREIPRDLADALTKSIERQIHEAVAPENMPAPKREGSTMEFLSFTTGRSAWTRSPPPQSPPGKLSELAAILKTMTQATGEDFARAQKRASNIARELAGP